MSADDMSNDEYEEHGAIGQVGYGYNYETSATENELDFISKIDDILNWGPTHLHLTDAEWESFNLAEDSAGSILIGTGVFLICASGVGLIPIALIAGGSTLCYFATGVNEVDDFKNPYYYIKASWSISSAIVMSACGGGEIQALGKVTSSTITKEVSLKEIDTCFREALAVNHLDKKENLVKYIGDIISSKFQDIGLDYVLNQTKGYVPS